MMIGQLWPACQAPMLGLGSPVAGFPRSSATFAAQETPGESLRPRAGIWGGPSSPGEVARILAGQAIGWRASGDEEPALRDPSRLPRSACHGAHVRMASRAVSSMAEQVPFKHKVTGSSPVRPTPRSTLKGPPKGGLVRPPGQACAKWARCHPGLPAPSACRRVGKSCPGTAYAIHHVQFALELALD
jgi:hypothetical protein